MFFYWIFDWKFDWKFDWIFHKFLLKNRLKIQRLKMMNSRLNFGHAVFPECVARVPVSLGGLGVRLCSPSFAFAFASVRKCPQVSATACGDAVRLSTVASVSGVVPKACQVESWCLCEWSVSQQLYWCLQRRCLWEWSVSQQLYWRLQRRCLWEWSVAPPLYWCLQRRCLCEWSVWPQLYWCLQRRCLWEWSVSPQLY